VDAADALKGGPLLPRASRWYVLAVLEPAAIEVEGRPDVPAGGAVREPPSAHGRRPARATASGIACVAASAVCFGTLPIFARLAYASGVDTSTLLLLRFSMAAGLMWLVVAARRVPVPRGRGLAMLVAMGALGYAGQAFAYFTAVSLASAGLAALLLYLYPAIVALLSRFVLGHRLSRLQIVAVAMALVGSVLTIGRAPDGSPIGVAFGVLAALVYSVYILTGGRLPAGITATASTTVVTSAAAAVYAAVVLARGAHLPRTTAGWGAVLALAVVCTVLAIALFLAGLERLGPVRASVFSTVEPATTLALAAALLGEQVTPLRAAGGALILAAVVLLTRGETAGA
jgi:drug/metabolite transporter (DMT)-like permease